MCSYKTFIEWGYRMILRMIKASVCVINTKLCLDNFQYHAQPHPITANWYVADISAKSLDNYHSTIPFQLFLLTWEPFNQSLVFLWPCTFDLQLGAVHPTEYNILLFFHIIRNSQQMHTPQKTCPKVITIVTSLPF